MTNSSPFLSTSLRRSNSGRILETPYTFSHSFFSYIQLNICQAAIPPKAMSTRKSKNSMFFNDEFVNDGMSE
jgi:hypothetical protein